MVGMENTKANLPMEVSQHVAILLQHILLQAWQHVAGQQRLGRHLLRLLTIEKNMMISTYVYTV